jgi:hypothetical protein
LRGDVLLSQQSASSARPATLEKVAGEKFYMRANSLAFNAISLRGSQSGGGTEHNK